MGVTSGIPEAVVAYDILLARGCTSLVGRGVVGLHSALPLVQYAELRWRNVFRMHD